MKIKNIEFTENLIVFGDKENKREFDDETRRKISLVSKTNKVPSLSIGDFTLSESLPILEFLNDRYPEKNLLPKDIMERAGARMLSGAIHSGLVSTKSLLPFVGDGRRKENKSEMNEVLKNDFDVLFAVLPEMKTEAYLYGEFSIADAMLIPFLMRYYCYNVTIPEQLTAYIEFAISSPEMQQWIGESQGEKEIEEIEKIYDGFST